MLGPVNSLLKENHLSEKQIKLLTTAVHSGEQLQQLINEILDLRKLELGKLELNLKAINLYSFFLRYTAQFESLAVGKAIDYIQQIDINEKAVGQLDREKCRQILHNLLSNAFKFTPNGGRITASIILDHQRLYITVSDTGRGIHPNDIGYIFNRYFQTNRPEKPIEGGTGIGLALCKEYVELLGGKIKVESTIDQGTTFKAFFPITLVEGDEVLEAAIVEEGNGTIKNSAANTPANSVLKVKTGKPRLLIVEDNPALSDYLTLILSEKYEVTTAEHGQQALDYIFADHNGDEKPINTFQLILSDLMMPVMDGYQLLEQLKAHNATRHIPVVMLTARAELRDKLKALRIGVDDYLVKPFEEDELLVRIHNLLQHQSNRNKEAQLDKSPPKEVPAISQEDQAWLVELEQFVQKNLANSILSVPMLADQFSMSESTLFRQMKRITGLSPLQYLKEVRLEKALRILENKQYNSIAKVAYEVGYADPNSFTRAFRLRFGKSPSKLITT
jgi:DNA-binding response OmpR family regulator/anti-sigma regulatory factor (Ser/Thr protein kinase)